VKISKDFEELLASFTARGVRALIVGGYAFAFHARPRNTKDLDLWIEPTAENVERLLLALDDFGFGNVGLTADDFLTPRRFVQLGFPPQRIDLLTSLKGVTFEEAWNGRVEDLFGSQKVCYIGKEELIRNKQAVGRPQDKADVSVLKPSTTKRKK